METYSPTEIVHRLPYDPSAEAAVLGAILLEPSTLWEVLEHMKPEDMYAGSHRAILEAARDIASEGFADPDLVTVSSILRDGGKLDQVGGASYLSSLVDQTPDVSNVGAYARIIHDHAMRRKLLALGQRILSMAAETSSEMMLGMALSELFGMTDDDQRRMEVAQLSDLVQQCGEKTVNHHERGASALGLTTGLRSIDQFFSGLKPGCMYYIAARPSMGKSVLADQIAHHVAEYTGRPVAVFITEMSLEARAYRRMSSITGISLPKLHSASLTRDEFDRVKAARCDLPVWYHDVSGQTSKQVRLLAQRFAAQHGRPALIVVDFLQQLHAQRRSSSLVERTNEKSMDMKEMTVELNCSSVVCSQLSRACEKENRSPRLSDLRESGNLEQDAHGVLFLSPVGDTPSDGRRLADVAKHRDGPTGSSAIKLNPEFMRFEDVNAIPEGGPW